MTAATMPEIPNQISPVEFPASVRATEPELAAVRQVALFIRAEADRRPALVGPDGQHLELPNSVYQVLREAVELLRRGESVSIVSANQELTTQQAAELLNISRPYLIRLLGKGEIPYHKTGTHRRILHADVVSYRAQRDKNRRRHLRQMVREADELSLYDVPEVSLKSQAPEA